MKFTVRFHGHAEKNIFSIVKEFGVPNTVIEIGCFEGDTTFNMAVAMTALNPNYRHYAIDPYGESADLKEDTIASAFTLFKDNLSEFNAQYPDVVRFINKDSWSAMIELYQQGVQADIIYVDGDHRSVGVLEDLVLGYRLLKIGGIMLCDDCNTWGTGKALNDCPRLAVDNFLHCYWNRIEMLDLPGGYQTAFRKVL